MAGLENLFATEPTLPNEQTTKLPDNAGEWAEAITTRIRESYPDSARLGMNVEFRKKDDSAGTAIGGVHLQDPESGKKIVVPFIVRKFELFPLDIWMETQTQAVHPLTNDTIKKEFFSTSMAQELDGRPADSAGQYFNDPSLWTTNYPPLQGRYSYASAGYQILDQISDTMAKDHLDEFRATLKSEPTLLLKFQKHGHQELIQKLARKSEVMTNDFVASAMKLIPVGVMSVKREGGDKYSLLSMADQMFDLVASEWIDRKTCEDRLSKITKDVVGVMNEVDQQGEKMLVVTQPPSKGVWLYDDMSEKPELIDEFCACAVKNKNGVKVEGVVIPQVVDFSGKKKGYKLFLSPSHSSMQDSIAGVERPDSEIAKTVLAPRAARVGQTGTFVLVDDGKAVATEPATIKAIDGQSITAVLLDGTKIKISRTFGDVAYTTPKGEKAKNFLDAHGMVEVRAKEYIIPSRMLWVPMEGFQDVSSSTSDYMMKEAASHQDANPMTVRWTGIVYQTEQDDIGKQELSERELKVVLASKGCPLDKTATIVAKAKALGRTKVYGLGRLRKKADIVKEAQQTAQRLDSLCVPIRQNLVKIAAELEDAATVDGLLSLGFINKDNLAKFVSYKPVFEHAVDYLAEILLAGRLGLKDVSASATSRAIRALVETIESLERVGAGLQRTTSRTG